MASTGEKHECSKFVNVGTLILEPADLDLRGIAVHGDKLMVTDTTMNKVHLHKRGDGMLISSSDKLASGLWGVCFVNDTDICVVLNSGNIELMSIQKNCLILMGKNINLQPSFDCCHDVAKFNDKLVVSGVKDKIICWCIVSLQNERLDKVQNVCEGRWSYLATKEDMIYVSCNGRYNENGVYGYNLVNPSQSPFIYKPEQLWSSSCGIAMDDNGYLYMCDWVCNSIHYLTDKCELVTIFTEGIPECPFSIFWDQGIIYVTGFGSNRITMYQRHQKGDHNGTEAKERNETKQPVIEPLTTITQGIRKMDFVGQMSSREPVLPDHGECQLPLPIRHLPLGKKHHAFFIYSSSHIEWVRKTIEKLEIEHGLVCCEYKRDSTPGTTVIDFLCNSIKDAYKIVIVMTRNAFQDNVLYECKLAITQYINENRDCIVPVLLETCEVPLFLRALNYIDARDPNGRHSWWSKFLTTLEK